MNRRVQQDMEGFGDHYPFNCASEDDVRAWYEKLLGDLLEIERGARA